MNIGAMLSGWTIDLLRKFMTDSDGEMEIYQWDIFNGYEVNYERCIFLIGALASLLLMITIVFCIRGVDN